MRRQLNYVREGAFDAAKEKGATDQCKQRHCDAKTKYGWVQNTTPKHRPAKALDAANDRIQREQSLPSR
jgi:hypothetical protein